MAKMDKSVQKTLIIVGGILLAIVIIFMFSKYFLYPSTISSTGTATIKVLPDMVSVYFSVDTKGTTAKEASDKNAEIVDKMKSSLLAAGIKDSEIKTQGFNVYPNYDYYNGGQRVTGYSATHSLKVEISVDEKDKIGSTIDAGVGAGAGVSYINYELNEENQKKYKVDAIKSATEDARTKAEALAEGAGSSLGSLVSISTSEFGYVPWLAASADSMKGSSGAEVATSINPSEQEVSASVTAVFRIR
jgi:uncharacterized protein YggE